MKQIYNHQNGRTMIEILSVLALIGILSITALKGYRIASEQIMLNKVSEVMDFAMMSIASDDTIYESMRKSEFDNGFFDEDVEYWKGRTDVWAEATKRFAKSYGFYCPEEEMGLGRAYAYGCPLFGKLYFGVGLQEDYWTTGEAFYISFLLKDSNNRQADLEIFKKVMERVQIYLKNNPNLLNNLYGAGGYNACFNNQKCVDEMTNSGRWVGGTGGSGKPSGRISTQIYFYY